MADTKSKLPKPQDLCRDLELMGQYSSWQQILDSKPRKEWVENHPIVKVKNKAGRLEPLQYLTIQAVKKIMRVIFGRYRVEVRDVKLILNSVVVTVRLHYFDPISLSWEWQDGGGAVGIQTNKGATAADLNAIKADALMKGAPAAKSYAFKNAAKELGALLGGELNSAAPNINHFYNVESDKKAFES